MHLAEAGDDAGTPSRARHKAGAGSGPDRFRPDIQALRAIAVAAVVLFHLWPGLVPGGYVGVDVFFAISGFLITSHLLSEVDSTGRLRAGRFWARRIKRLQPAALLVLAVSTAGIVAWVPRHLWIQFLQEILASTFQLQNWLLAFNSVDYLAADNLVSPVQHYWTLSVEEQFYVGLPLLMLLGLAVARRGGLDARRVIFLLLAATFVGSLSLSVWQTTATPSFAYLSTLTRAWEFAGGALLAMLAIRPGPRAGAAAPWLGLLAILVACFAFGHRTLFPGISAALPVFGALACLWAGERSFLDRLGRMPPVAFVGRVSYAIYLWHWPLLILVPYAMGREADTPTRLAILAATVSLAWASTRFVEDPIRFSPRLLGNRPPRTVAAWSVAAMAIVVAVPFLLVRDQSSRVVDDAGLAAAVVASDPSCLGAAALDPAQAPCANPRLNGILIPSLASAKADDANRVECWGSNGGEAKLCQLGPATGYTRRLYAIGDSHSNTLIGVYESLATRNNWRIDLSGTGGCYLTSGRQQQPSAAAAAGCEAWKASVVRHAHAGRYDAFLVTHSSGDRLVVPEAGESVESATVAGLVAAWRRLPANPIIAIRDNPAMPGGTMECVAQHGLEAGSRCAPARQAALMFDGQAEAARQVSHASFLDLTDYYCTPEVCPPVVGNVLVYRDGRHLTATYARTMTPYIERGILAALDTTSVASHDETPH